MENESKIQALKAKHAALEAAIEDENSRPLPSSSELGKLKKQKLLIKEQIEQLDTVS